MPLGAIQIDSHKGICGIEGADYPMIGFGTYRLTGRVCTDAVGVALQTGYRMIDTATFYENFDGIAQALIGQDRCSVYLISKVWHDQLSPEKLRKDLNRTLLELKTDYLDAYLIHWPNSAIPIQDTLGAMHALQQENKIRHIGLSNVSVNHLKKALETKIPIKWVQVEMHPYFYDRALLEFCAQHGIHVQAWRPLGAGRTAEDPLLIQIGKKHGKTASQVALKWIVQHGCISLPSSQHQKRIQQNFDALNFHLLDEEMLRLNQRAVSGERFRLKLDHGLGFKDEFDFTYEQCWPT